MWQFSTPSELMNARKKSPNPHNNSSLFTKAHDFHWNPLNRSTSLWSQFFFTPSSPLQLVKSCFWQVVTPAERALNFLNTSPISPTQITHHRHWAASLFSHFSAFRQIHQDLVEYSVVRYGAYRCVRECMLLKPYQGSECTLQRRRSSRKK